MGLKTPKFWYETKSLNAKSKAILLMPFSWLYHLGHFLHYKLAASPFKVSVPVICIGNLVAGGSGKTPTALALMQLVHKKHLYEEPVFLSRGYKGRKKGPLLVDLEKHTAHMVGDEPLLLARDAQTIIAKNRKKGAAFATNTAHADLIVMDDGLQNPHLVKDIKLAIIDGKTGFGNGKTLPAGPLREKMAHALPAIDAFILIGRDEQDLKNTFLKDRTVFEAMIKVPDDWICDRDIPYVAFTGIGRPEKFYSSLHEKGLNIAAWRPYPDHHYFTPRDLKSLKWLAEEKNARLITTEKDAVRLPEAFKKEITIDIMPIILEFKEEDAFLDFLKNSL